MKVLAKSLFALAALLALPVLVSAQPSAYVEGTHYDVLDKPVRTADPSKIEVTEVFWYGCQHCYAFEPLLESWVEKLPEDVAFVRVPGMWNELMETHARIYYAAEALDVFDTVHPAAFDAIHQQGNYLQTEDAIRGLFVEAGVDPAEFDKTWSSFSTVSAVQKAKSRMRDYGIRSVPAVIVNGKYRIGGSGIRNFNDILGAADFLMDKERQAAN